MRRPLALTLTLTAIGVSWLAPPSASAQRHAPAVPVPAPAPAPASDDRLSVDSALEHAARRPDDLVTLSLENADLSDLVRTMSEMTGRRFVVATTAKSFQATVVSPQKVTVAEAYQAFLSILAANHLTVVPRGRFLKIIDAQDAVHEAPVRSTREGVVAEERYVTYVHRVSHVQGDEMAAVLAKLASHDGAVIPYGNVLLLTDTGASVQRMMRVLDELDVAQAEDKVWLEPLQFVPSADVKKELDELLDSKTAEKDKTRLAGAPGGARVTKLVALDRPNALLVVGSQGGYERLLELLRAIDVATPSEGQMHVVMLQHADAKKIVGPINEAVSAAATSPGGGATAPGVNANAARVLEAPVKVSAEETSNALIVTASAHDFAAVREVIRRLDQPRRQVYIEAVVLDLSVTRTNALEAAFHGFAPASADGSVVYGGSNPMKSLLLPTDSTSLQALVLGVRGPSVPVPDFLQSTLGTSSIPGLGFFLDAYTVAGDSDILQTPHILATDNTPAEIHVQLNTSLQRNAPSYGSPTSTSTAAGAAGALSGLSLLSAPATANYGKIGPKIKITPHIDESDDVRLDVEETISDLGTNGPQGSLGTIDFTERGATTTLTVKDTHTAVIGGLVRDQVQHNVTKIPLLGEIPILGFLFRSSQDVMQKSNLILILTPHIIRNEDDMREIFEKRMRERQEFLDHYFVFRDGPPLGFDPKHGRGALAELRAEYDELAERRRLESQVPPSLVAAHDPRPPLDMPSTAAGVAAPQGASPPPAQAASLHVTPPARTVDRVEK
ncbi:MAG: type II secretion system secretin GspD [Polyangiaceae bacterium]|jgi:general secretion pathway protein D